MNVTVNVSSQRKLAPGPLFNGEICNLEKETIWPGREQHWILVCDAQSGSLHRLIVTVTAPRSVPREQAWAWSLGPKGPYLHAPAVA